MRFLMRRGRIGLEGPPPVARGRLPARSPVGARGGRGALAESLPCRLHRRAHHHRALVAQLAYLVCSSDLIREAYRRGPQACHGNSWRTSTSHQWEIEIRSCLMRAGRICRGWTLGQGGPAGLGVGAGRRSQIGAPRGRRRAVPLQLTQRADANLKRDAVVCRIPRKVIRNAPPAERGRRSQRGRAPGSNAMPWDGLPLSRGAILHSNAPICLLR
jgi:hypothetical protein